LFIRITILFGISFHSFFDARPWGGGMICDLISGFIMEQLSAISFDRISSS